MLLCCRMRARMERVLQVVFHYDLRIETLSRVLSNLDQFNLFIFQTHIAKVLVVCSFHFSIV